MYAIHTLILQILVTTCNFGRLTGYLNYKKIYYMVHPESKLCLKFVVHLLRNRRNSYELSVVGPINKSEIPVLQKTTV